MSQHAQLVLLSYWLTQLHVLLVLVPPPYMMLTWWNVYKDVLVALSLTLQWKLVFLVIFAPMLDRYTTKLVKAVFVPQLLHTSQVQPVLIAILLLTGILLPNHVKHAIYKTINITVLIKMPVLYVLLPLLFRLDWAALIVIKLHILIRTRKNAYSVQTIGFIIQSPKVANALFLPQSSMVQAAPSVASTRCSMRLPIHARNVRQEVSSTWLPNLAQYAQIQPQ